MKNFTYVVQGESGVHARPAGKLVSFLSPFKSKVTIKFEDRQANAKSIINLMTLVLPKNSSIEFVIEGEDEDQVFTELPEFLKKENI